MKTSILLTEKEYEIQGFYSGTWECVTAESTYKEAKAQAKCYRENELGTAFRIVEKRPLRTFSLTELLALPTISSGHFDDLKIEKGVTRVWLSRMTKEDGMPYNNQVTVERLVNGNWKQLQQYQAY